MWALNHIRNMRLQCSDRREADLASRASKICCRKDMNLFFEKK